MRGILSRMRSGIPLARAVGIVLLAALFTGAGRVPSARAGDTPYSVTNQLDLNRASLAEIEQLPIPATLAKAIYEHREYRELYGSIYDLFDVPGMTSQAFATLRDIVKLSPRFVVDPDAAQDDRLESAYDLAQRLLSQEGVSEGLVDEYVDMLRVPRNVNNMDFFELTGVQNVSPIDAVAILKARKEKPFDSAQELRRAPGLSYYGFRNLRDYIRYSDEDQALSHGRFRGDAQLRVYNTPYQLDESDNLHDQLAGSSSGVGPQARSAGQIRDYNLNTLWGRLNLDQSRPYLTSKLRARYGDVAKFGMLTHRNLGEEKVDETLKWFVGTDDHSWGPLRLNHAYVGNYRLAFGSGLLMDNNDFFQARRTGTGFSTRQIGLRGDLSRSDESALKGAAAEATLGILRGTFFYSEDDKDAILNPDYSFNRYITMVPRVDNETLADIRQFARAADSTAFLPMRDVMREKVAGTNLKLRVLPTTFVGVTAMEMKYENNLFRKGSDEYLGRPKPAGVDLFNPRAETLIIEPSRIEPRDAEIAGAYDSRKLGNFRDLVGAEFQSVYRNVVVQGEYGKLLTTPKDSFTSRAFAGGPEAYLVSGFLQYDNLNFFALYRDTDLGYDNPYNRGFSETNRYDQTLLGDEFRLYNPMYAFLADNDPQPKPERGFYFTTRYQVSRNITINYLEYDNYYRKVDHTQQERVTLSAEYRPVFPVRFRVRQRFSQRDGKGADDVRDFKGWESRFEARCFLSKYDRLDFLYSTSTVIFGPRPRLSGSASGTTPEPSTHLGTRSIPAQGFQAAFTHNWTPGFTTTISSEIYDGFIYNFEDNEFIAVDSRGFRNWFLVRSRLSGDLSWRLKYTVDDRLPVTWIDVRNFSNVVAPTPDGTNGKHTENSFRFQLDYTF